MGTLSRVLLHACCDDDARAERPNLELIRGDLRSVGGLNRSQWNKFLELAHSHHVTMRALAVLQNAAAVYGENELAEKCEAALTAERAPITHAVGFLQHICQTLGSQGCDVTVINSLDHYPDLGYDLDLFTTADSRYIQDVMCREFDACQVARSWGDRLANKWNFQLPGLPELVEIHVQFLGQTGEHESMAKRVIERRVAKGVWGYRFHVPAPEERLVISALQRVYRHFYFRLFDMLDATILLNTEAVDFFELRKTAQLAGIWSGIATFLCLVRGYVEAYGGSVALPCVVTNSAQGAAIGLRFKDGFLRMSKLSAASLYGSQLMQAGLHRDRRALARLPLLPPLAVSALVAYHLTGNDKGIW